MIKRQNTRSQLSNRKQKNTEDKERKCLHEIKQRLGKDISVCYEDTYLLKWLQARQFDVKRAEKMFKQNLLFKERYGVNDIINTYKPPEVLRKYLTGGMCGHDKDGRPVRIELFGKLDMKGLMYSAKKLDMEKYKILQSELMIEDCKLQSEKLGKTVDQITVIFDMEEVGTKMLWKPGLQMYLHLVKVLEDNYPEMINRMFVINAPVIFPLLYKLCRPMISEDMKNKIHILGDNYQSILLSYIDAEELPGFLGGKRLDPDGNPRCQSLICHGGIVPESYYCKESESIGHFENITVLNGQKLELKYEVTKPATVLSWEFQTLDYDIGFGIFLQKDSEMIPVLPVARINSHMIPDDGSLSCQQIGTYVVCFDNTFSWTRSKKLKYNIDLTVDNGCLKSEINELVEDKVD